MQRTFREIMFLQELTTHDNIIKCALFIAALLSIPTLLPGVMLSTQGRCMM